MSFYLVALVLVVGNCGLFGWIAVNGRLPGTRRRQPSPRVARLMSAVAIGTTAMGVLTFGWILGGDDDEPVPRLLLAPLFISLVAYSVVMQWTQWRYPLRRDEASRERNLAVGPVRWRWVLKTFVLIIGILILAVTAVAIVGGLVSLARPRA